MKKFSLILILIFSFQSWTKADDARNFQIEGISIEDSLLDHFSEEEILTNQKDWYREDEFKASRFKLDKISSEYNSIIVHYKNKDKKFIIDGGKLGGLYFIY